MHIMQECLVVHNTARDVFRVHVIGEILCEDSGSDLFSRPTMKNLEQTYLDSPQSASQSHESQDHAAERSTPAYSVSGVPVYR